MKPITDERERRWIARLRGRYVEYATVYGAVFVGGLPLAVPITISWRARREVGATHFQDHGPRREYISISGRHILEHGWHQVRQTLLHEMIHVWQHFHGGPRAVAHDAVFRAKAHELGIQPKACRQVRPLRIAA